MPEKCEFVVKCPIAKYFDETSQQILLGRYCYGNSQKCARYARRKTNQAVPEFMMPWDGLDEWMR